MVNIVIKIGIKTTEYKWILNIDTKYVPIHNLPMSYTLIVLCSYVLCITI